MTIDQMIEITIGHEGKYSNHPDDTGGETMWGITKAVARKNGYTGPMAQLPRAEAVRIYREEYAVKPWFDVVASIYPKLGAELFDSGVNLGPKWPSLWLQISLNVFNNQGQFYADIAEDGKIGAGTIRALRAYKQKRGDEGEDVICKAVNCLQGARYIDITRNRERNESFIYGWFRNRVGL